MKRLKELGFKKIKTEPGFHMYELTPATLRKPRSEERTSAQTSKSTSNTKFFGRHQAHKFDK